MADDFDSMIRALRSLADLPSEAARLGAPLVLEAIQSTARAGTAPDGTPWQPKQDGSRPLVHAADHITAAAYGPIIRVTLTGVDVYHHRGAGSPRRPILPDPGSLPPPVAEALHRAASRAFEKATGSR